MRKFIGDTTYKFTNGVYHSLIKILVLKETTLFCSKFNRLLSLNKINAKK